MSDSIGFYDGNRYNGQVYAPQYVATGNLGPYFVGLMLQLFLAGIAFGNFGRYLNTATYASDSRAHRILLWAVMVQLALVTGLGVELCIWHGVSQKRSIDAIFAMTVPDGVGPATGGVVAALVQGFLLVRAARLLRRNRIGRAVFLAVGFLAILLAYLAAVAQSVANLSLVFDFWEQMGPFTFSATGAINLWISAALDLFLSTTLILALRGQVLGFNHTTDSTIRRLIRTSATTASYTAVFSTIAAALAVARPASSLTGATNFLAFAIPGPSLYALSMLATLAARKPPAPSSAAVKFSLAPAASDPSARPRSRIGMAGRRLSQQASRSLSLSMAGLDGASVGAPWRSEGGPMGCAVRVRTETEVVVDVGRAEDGVDTRRFGSRVSRWSAGGGGGGGDRDGGLSALVLPAREKRRPSVRFVKVPCEI